MALGQTSGTMQHASMARPGAMDRPAQRTYSGPDYDPHRAQQMRSQIEGMLGGGIQPPNTAGAPVPSGMGAPVPGSAPTQASLGQQSQSPFAQMPQQNPYAQFFAQMGQPQQGLGQLLQQFRQAQMMGPYAQRQQFQMPQPLTSGGMTPEAFLRQTWRGS